MISRAIKHGLAVFALDPNAPTGFGHIEIPIQTRIDSHMAVFALPIACGIVGHNVTGPRDHCCGRRCEAAAGGCGLDQNVQDGQSLVMCHVFLGLRRLDKGQRLQGCCGRHE